MESGKHVSLSGSFALLLLWLALTQKRTKRACLINDHFNFTYLTDRIIMLQLNFFVLRSYREIYINSPKTFGFFKVNHFHFFFIIISQL